LLNPDYTQNPAKIYEFGNCKATATPNKRRKLVQTPVLSSHHVYNWFASSPIHAIMNRFQVRQRGGENE
jgi:hypothetical protein